MEPHHISLLTADFERNFDFYVNILGLRLVKNSINQGNIYMRHVYYGDFMGTPGTVVTFFPDQRFDVERQEGTNYLSGIQFKIPKDSTEYWTQRFKKFGLEYQHTDNTLQVLDFDNILLEFIEVEEKTKMLTSMYCQMYRQLSKLQGLGAVVSTAQSLRRHGSFPRDARERGRHHASARKNFRRPPSVGRGSIDHIAFAVPNSKALDKIWERALSLGYERELYADRGYFRSVYLKEPGGVRIEFATPTPGFTLDESIQDLGSSLALPPRYEAKRQELLSYYQKQGVHFKKRKKKNMKIKVQHLNGRQESKAFANVEEFVLLQNREIPALEDSAKVLELEIDGQSREFEGNIAALYFELSK
ncbi:ring-cleaving dioxygenase [Lactococcus garvieae]